MTIHKTCAALALTLAIAGCSDAGDDARRPDATDPTSSTASPASTSSPSSSVAPATGTAMTSDWLDLRLPAEADWNITRNGRSGHHSLAEVVRSAVSVIRESRPSATQGANRAVAGVEGITVTAEDDRGYLYRFDTALGGFEYSISFQFPVRDAASEAWIESILASVAWKVGTPAG